MKRIMTSFVVAFSMIFVMFGNMGMVYANNDIEAPKLISIKTNHQGETLSPGDELEVTAEVQDESELGYCIIYFNNESSSHSESIIFQKGDDGKLHGKLTIDNDITNGVYKVGSILLYDKYDNVNHIFNHGQYDDLGFTVINANSDTEAPKLISIKTNHQGETLSPGDELEVTAEVQDESELGYCIIYFNNESSSHSESIIFQKGDDGKLHGKLTIDNDITNGVYKVGSILLYDKYDNVNHIFNHGQYDDLGFTVINANSDTEAPKLISIKTNHQGENLSPGDELEVTAEVQDESELGYCIIYFNNESSSHSESIIFQKEDDGKLHGKLTIDNDITNGVYKVGSILLYDKYDNVNHIFNDGQYDDLKFTVVEDEELKKIKSIDHAYVVSSSTANKTYDGDVYIAPNCNVTLSNVTVKGTIYVLGALQANSINAKGIVGTSLSFGGWAYGNGSISVSGSNSYESLKMTSYPVEDIPFKLTTEELKSVNGKISYSGAVVDIADMYVNDRKVNVIDGKFHVKNQDIGDADQLTFKWVTVFGNTITKQFKVKKVVTDTTGKENNLPELNVTDQNVCVESDLSFLKQGISAKDDEDGDLTNKIQIDSHALDISRVGTYPVDYAVEDSQNGKTKKTISIHVNEHQWNSPTAIKKATCTQDGLQEKTCSVCGKKETKVIPALGHNFGDWKPLNDKQHQRVCKNDNSHVEKANHHFDEGKITTEPTYTKEGIKIYTCKDCGYTKTEKVAIIPHTHNYKDEVTKQPTCTDQGIKTYTCSICGDTYTKAIPALGHNYGDWKPFNDQQHQRVCKNDSTHVEKEDHKWDQGTVTKQPTCTDQGIKTYTCSICGDSYTKAIPALGHNYGEWTKADDKQHQRVCKNDSTHVEKEDHKWDQGKVTKATTTDTEGVKTYTCTVCHATKEEKIAKLPAVKKDEPKTQAASQSTNTSTTNEKKEADAQEKENTTKQPQPMTKTQDAKPATKASPKVQSSTTQVIDRKVTTLKGDRDISGSQFGLLQAKANKVTKSSIKVQWKKIKGAKGYVIYGNKCGKKYQKLTSVKGLSWTQRKLKKGTYYKYMVVAYNGKGKAIAYSKTIHVTTLGGKKVNPTNVKLKSPKKLTLKVKKKAQIKASYVLAKKAKMSNHRGLAYESSNTKVASVSKKGQITAKKKGVCTIYVYGQNGSMNKVQLKVQ